MRLVVLAVLFVGCSRSAPPAAPTPEVDSEAVSEPLGAVRVASQGADVDLERVQAFLDTRPIYERPLGVGHEVPAGLGSMSAASCGACHTDIYEEWKVSTHAYAWKDRQYQEEIAKSDNRWLCLNCHTPLLAQQDVWPVGLVDDDVERPQLVDNPTFDAELRSEGITCASCHVREGVIHGPGLGGQAPHAVAVDSDFQSEALCLRCHQATATYPGKSFVCVFNTGQEWAEGPYPAQGKNCVSCHMPEAERPAALGGPVRTVRQHWWRGAGIPKVAGVHPPPEANPPGLALTAGWQTDGLHLEAVNANAGHYLPSGDPERWVQVVATFHSEAGEPLGEAWSVRFGQEWTWWPEPVKHGDTRLAPLESRSYVVPLPPGATSATVVASSHRMSEETAEYHELEGYPLSIETHRLTVTP